MIRRMPQLALIGIAIWLASPRLSSALDPDSQQIMQKHLDSIGAREARAAIQSRLVEGVAQYNLIVGGTGQSTGTASFASMDHQIRLRMDFPPDHSRDEWFAYDGEKVSVSQSLPSRPPSIEEFMHTEDAILKNGFLGGVLSTAWPPLDTGKSRSILVYEGLKAIGGKKLHTIRCRTRDSSLEIRLYFDPDTFHHVLTTYTISVPPGYRRGVFLRRSPGYDPALIPSEESVSKLEERFSDFKTVNGLTFPTEYDLHFAQVAPDGGQTEKEWRMRIMKIENNPPLDRTLFRAR
jgi:hypothetical protein